MDTYDYEKKMMALLEDRHACIPLEKYLVPALLEKKLGSLLYDINQKRRFPKTTVNFQQHNAKHNRDSTKVKHPQAGRSTDAYYHLTGNTNARIDKMVDVEA